MTTDFFPARSSPRIRSGLFALVMMAVASAVGLANNAHAASDIAQRPLISSQSGDPNVMLMMDDSNSMGLNWLPAPPDFDMSMFPGSWFDVTNNSGSTTRIPAGWITGRNSRINPLYYDPTITYRPWNDNNKPAASNFPPANTGTFSGGVAVDGTPVDPRFIQDGVNRVRYTTSWIDLFTRPPGTRGTDICLATTTGPVTYCSAGYWSGATTEVSNATYTCTAYATVTQTYCSAYRQDPNLVEGHYYVFVGDWATERYVSTKYRLVEIDRAFPARMYPTPVDPATGVQANRADCSNPTSCTFAEEAQNYANWYTYFRTRLFAAISVTSTVLSQLNSPLRLGYGRINYFAGGPVQWPGYASTAPGATLPALDGLAAPGHIVRGVRDFRTTSADRQPVFDWLFTLNPVAATPNREALDAAGRYFSRTDAQGPWSTRPGVGPGGGTSDLSCRRSYTILATDGAWTDLDVSVQPRISTMYPSGSGTPLESDSVAGPSLSGSGRQAGRNYQYTPASEPGISTNSSLSGTLADVAFYYWSRDLRPDLINNNAPVPWPGGGTNYPGDYSNPSTWQNMSTMILGYGLIPSRNNATVEAALRSGSAIAWPTVNPAYDNDPAKVDDSQRAAYASRGSFFSAVNPTSLATGLTQAFQAAVGERSSSSGIGISSAIVRDSNDLVFEASYQAGDWTGTLTAIEALGLLTSTRTERWTASAPAFATRRVFTSTNATSGTALQWANLTSGQQTAIGASTLVNYMKGDTSLELPAGPYRARKAPFGTIVHSTPLYSKATNYGLQTAPTAGGPGYATYLANKTSSRRASVMVNANDGMFHSFDAANGNELFAFMPRAVLPSLAAYADPAYDHFYLVDGQVAEGDIYVGGAWSTIAVGTGGAGPISLFGLDVTDPTAFGAGKVRFDLTDADIPELGHVMGRVLITSTVAGKWVAITGNGYESAAQTAVLLIIDLATGSVLRKIDTGVGSTTAGQHNGMGPVTPIYNGKRDVIGLYAGDKLGNLWKFDLSSASPSDWKIAGGGTGPLFSAADSLGVPQPITTEVRVTQHPLGGLYLAFGTGQYFENGDPANKQVQSLYFLRDRSDVTNIAKSSLKQATLSDAAVSGFRELSGLSGPGGLDWNVNRGWYVNLITTSGSVGDGERIIAPPILSSGKVLFTSFRPTAADPCAGGGDSLFYSFDLATDMTRAAFDSQSVNVVGRYLPEGVPGGLLPLYSPAAAPGPVTSALSMSQLNSLTASARYRISSPGSSSGARCGGVGAGVRSKSLTVDAACVSVMPLRSWRDMR